jgi:glucose-6-phosphate isomerase
MIKLHASNTKVKTDRFQSRLKDYLKKIEKANQGFYSVIDDKKTIVEIKDFAKKTQGKYQHIIVLGIGGSALGTICLQHSFQHLFEFKNKNTRPKLHVIDNIDPVLIKELDDIIGTSNNLKKTLFIVVSKSGTTNETLFQYSYFRNKTDKANLDAKKHFVFITDPKKGELRKIAKNENIPSFEIPENVGGRFSVFCAGSLLPATLTGINPEKLIKGAKEMQQSFLNKNFKKNLPFQLASIQYALAQKGKNIHVLMPYSQKLIKLTDWYKQLLAESIGKKKNKKGKIINTGITPINALGATDQHSQTQLYNEGPKDKLIIFIEIKNYGKEIKIPSNSTKNLSFNKLIQIEKSATEKSLSKNNRPNLTIEIDSVNEESLGALLMFFMGSVAFLGEFHDVNTYDQPGVELCKKLTKQALQKL